MYHKISLAINPTQTPECDFEPHSYGQMYFLDPNETVKGLLL